MGAPKILQTISTLHILTAFYIADTRSGIILIVFLVHYLPFLQKDQDTLIVQSGNTLIKQSALKHNLIL